MSGCTPDYRGSAIKSQAETGPLKRAFKPGHNLGHVVDVQGFG